MKKCVNCGKDIIDNALFCVHCGSRQPDAKIVLSTNPPKKNNLKKIALFIGIPLIILLMGFIAFKLFYKPTVTLNDYLEASFEGYEGIGKLVLKYDEMSYKERIDKIIPKNVDKYIDTIDEEFDYQFKNRRELIDYFRTFDQYIIVDKVNRLENDQSIHLGWNIGAIEEYKEIAEVCGFNVQALENEILVTGLLSVRTIDFFDQMSVEYLGLNGSGKVELAKDIGEYDFPIENNGHLSNGDKFTLEFTEKQIEDMIEKKGERPSPSSKEYVVEGLLEFVKDTSDLKGKGYETLKEKADEEIEAFKEYFDPKTEHYLFNIEYGNNTINDATLVATYVYYKKDSVNAYYQNMVEFVYKVNTSTEYEKWGEQYNNNQDSYFCVSFNNVALGKADDPNVTYDYVSDDRQMYDSFRVDLYSSPSNRKDTFSYYGHDSLEDYETDHNEKYGNNYVSSKIINSN